MTVQPAGVQACCHDGVLTDEPIKVGEVHTPAGVGAEVFSCPQHLPLYRAQDEMGPAS
ncbi:hypothetical protein DWB77_02491 [Streptomyces hundungensis]|uniref:Uncharacterized protein n=1 Tax=Streptomyces hundungensis TaxID=1077946 RepID=A0A387HHK5_9ACTN|nr:hypothetical protein [Streptomyces hundungensis]AYG80360.1 hypothetical protein DWB77_02491 [Streptomyces hundungensis]